MLIKIFPQVNDDAYVNQAYINMNIILLKAV